MTYRSRFMFAWLVTLWAALGAAYAGSMWPVFAWLFVTAIIGIYGEESPHATAPEHH